MHNDDMCLHFFFFFYINNEHNLLMSGQGQYTFPYSNEQLGTYNNNNITNYNKSSLHANKKNSQTYLQYL